MALNTLKIIRIEESKLYMIFSRHAKPVPIAIAVVSPSLKLSIFLMENIAFITRNFTISSIREAIINALIKVLDNPITDPVLLDIAYSIKLAGKTAKRPAIIGINISSVFKLLLCKRIIKIIIPNKTESKILINKFPITKELLYLRGFYKISVL
jgi:hypothetical protein